MTHKRCVVFSNDIERIDYEDLVKRPRIYARVSGRSGALMPPCSLAQVRTDSRSRRRVIAPEAARHSLWSHEVWLNSQLITAPKRVVYGASSNFGWRQLILTNY